MIQLMLDTELRLSEVCNLKWKDIDLNTGKLIVRQDRWYNSSVLSSLSERCRIRKGDHHEGYPLQGLYEKATYSL